jgi:putative membrane protein
MKVRTIALTAALLACTGVSAFAQGFSDKDKQFLKDSSEGNLAEIKTAQLALKTSKNAEVRSFAQEMIKDHTALNESAKPVAAKAGLTPPSSPSVKQDAIYLKLKALSGETFDKSYVKSMVEDHHEDLQMAKQENATTTNPEMKKLSGHAADVIAQHTQKIEGIASQMGVK